MKDLFGDKVERAKELLIQFQPKDRPYWGCDSFGKDSSVCLAIAEEAGINAEWHYQPTTLDPPELVRFGKKNHPKTIIHKAESNFFDLAEVKGIPGRRNKWCCEVFKEMRSPHGSTLIMGVRAKESKSRAKNWREVKAFTKTGQYVVSPIFDWTKSEVWQFIKSRSIPYCELYDQGFDRLGCVGCPMGKNPAFEMSHWPHFEKRWKRLFSIRFLKKNRGNFKSSDEWFRWWLSKKSLPKDDECQGILDMYS